MRHRTPADGPPEPGPDRVLAFGHRLDLLDRELQVLYARLGDLAAELETDAAEDDEDPDWLAAMGRRLALGEIRSAVLDARHRLHGGLIGIIRARPQAGTPGREAPR